MAYDIVIKNGLVIDGSGMPGARTDVGIKDGRIVERGKIDGRATRVLNAEGRVVSPGFIDIHTHYDPHWWWNPLGTSSSWHGVTTVVTGNCGLTLAPCKPQHRRLLAGIFGTVEEVTMATLDAVLPWSWESFRDYLKKLEGHVGINVAPFLGHSAIRLYVMGDAAGERAATEDEIERMKDVVRQAMEAGAFGWTTSMSATHVGPTGDPVPSRFASNEELYELASVLAEYNCGTMEIIPPNSLFGLGDKEKEMLRQIALRSGRPINWLGHAWKWFKPDLWKEEQQWMAQVSKEGALLFANLTMQPFDREVNYKRTTFFNGLEVWREIMKVPLDERKAKLADPALRPALRHAMDNPDLVGKKGQVRPPIRWEGVTVLRAKLPKNKWMEGKSVPELAKQRGVHKADFMNDLAVEEDLETVFRQRFALETDTNVIGEMIQSPFVMLGASDSGAHINSECNSAEPTYCVKRWVVDHNVLTLEEAVRRWTSVPAAVFGMRDRGLIREGMKADVIVFSPGELQLGKKELVQDVPSGETRWVQKAQGIDYTIVNGRVLMDHAVPSGEMPGEVLRSAAYRSA